MHTRNIVPQEKANFVKHYSLVAEAVLALAIARLSIVALPFRWLAPWLERKPSMHSAPDGIPLKCVRRAVRAAAQNVPWNAVCLPQAIAAKVMLACRRIGSFLLYACSALRVKAMVTRVQGLDALLPLVDGKPAAMPHLARLFRVEGRAERAIVLCRRARALSTQGPELRALAAEVMSAGIPIEKRLC